MFHPYFGKVYREGEGQEDKPKTFTQEELNAILAADKKKHQEKLKKMEDDLAKLKSAGADVEPLKAKIEELNNTLLTKEELAKKQAKADREKHDNDIKVAKAAQEHWENQYKNLLLQNEISKAAVEHDAYDAEQLGALLSGRTKLVPTTDDKGTPTGNYKVLTQVTVDGKALEMPLGEAVGEMRKDTRFANQFKVKGSPGTGLTLNTQPGGTSSGSGMPDFKDPAKALAWYKEQKKAGNIRFQ